MSNHIQSMLCLSTVHIKPETMIRLQEGDFEWLVSYRKEHPSDSDTVYGAFVLAGDISLEEGNPEIADIPEDLLQVLNYADAFHCAWIMFDVDEDEIGELPTYRSEWDAAIFCPQPDIKPEAKEQPQQNTVVHYMYRDGSNYKLWFEEILHGSMSDAEMASFESKHAEECFYPAKLGLPAPTFVSEGYAAYDDDPDCHEFCGLERTDLAATVELSVQDFVKKFPDAACGF